MKKELTICMPVYNGEKYLDESIGSVLGQTYSNFKFLIYDDGSTDGSVEKVKSFNDKRIELIEGKENHGGIWARTELIKAIDTKYCMWIDNDDRYCRNDAFEEAMNTIKSNDYDFVSFPKMFDLYPNGERKINVSNMYDDFSYCGNKFFEKFYPVDNYVIFHSKIFKTELMKKSVPEDEILSRRFCTDDVFFSPLWYFCAERYCHVVSSEPMYEYKRGIGFFGKIENEITPQRIGDLCVLYYNAFVSTYNRMASLRPLTERELNNFIIANHLFMIPRYIKFARQKYGDSFADGLVAIWHSAFCADGIHLLNGIDTFVCPQYIKSLEELIK